MFDTCHLPNLIVTQIAEVGVDFPVPKENASLAPDGVGLVERTAELRLTQVDAWEPALDESIPDRIRDVRGRVGDLAVELPGLAEITVGDVVQTLKRVGNALGILGDRHRTGGGVTGYQREGDVALVPATGVIEIEPPVLVQRVVSRRKAVE